MTRKQSANQSRESHQIEARKVGILLPDDVYAAYERIARDEHITIAQVIARVAVEFIPVEVEASRSRRKIFGRHTILLDKDGEHRPGAAGSD